MDTTMFKKIEPRHYELAERMVKNGGCRGVDCVSDSCMFFSGISGIAIAEFDRCNEVCADLAKEFLKLRDKKEGNMTKLKIDGKNYEVDVKRAIELGVLKEETFNLMPERCYKNSENKEYFYIDRRATIGSYTDTNTEIDTALYECGNYFKSEAVAKYIIDNEMNPFNKVHNYIAHKNVSGDIRDGEYTIGKQVVDGMYLKRWVGTDYCHATTTEAVADELLEKLRND